MSVSKLMGKIPPQAVDVEQAILGSLMLDQDAIHEVIGIIDANSFYNEQHRKIFTAISELNHDCKPIDMITVTQKLKAKNQLNEIGGPIYIMDLTRNIASASHIKHHAFIIQQQFIKRELIRISATLTEKAFDEGEDIEDIMNEFRLSISNIEDYSSGTNCGKNQPIVIEETIIEIEADCALTKSGKTPGITTGLNVLDEATGGWRNTNLIIVASRPSVGKTSLALHFAKMAAMAGKWVNFYGLEMSSTDLMRIMISGESSVNRSNIRDGYLSDGEWDEINKSTVALEKLPIIWNDFAGITASQIKAQTLRNSKAGKCDIVIIDYLQLITPSDKKNTNREQQISEITRTLKRVALDQKIPIILLSQLNREASKEKPALHHLRESGAIEQDADVVIFPHKTDEEYMIIIAKNRRGKKGEFGIFANEEMTVFGNIEPDVMPNIPSVIYKPVVDLTLVEYPPDMFKMGPNKNFDHNAF